MWANVEVAEFLDWLRSWNLARPEKERVGFYGLDVYSLWDSLRVIMRYLERCEPHAVEAANRAWQCFLPYGEEPHRYAWETRIVPASCESEVVALLSEVVQRATALDRDGDEAFDAVQNAVTAVQAERYYRVMVRTDRSSWNIRDRHMVDTITRIARHLGHARGIVWEHNTHVGDARATDMARAGMVNVGQLLRERFGPHDVALVGLAAHRGSVIAARAWGEPEQEMAVPPAQPGSHEDLLHQALGEPSVILLDRGTAPGWLYGVAGHRAIGVIYQPTSESGNYVPTVMGDRYDALLWFEDTSALIPLHHESVPLEPEYETEPTGFGRSAGAGHGSPFGTATARKARPASGAPGVLSTVHPGRT